jgi:hypothetical protein
MKLFTSIIIMGYLIVGCETGYEITSEPSGYLIDQPADVDAIDVFIFAGQSNMMANCIVSDQTIPGYDTQLTNGYIWDRNLMSMDLITPGVNTTYNRPTGYYNNGFGPETAFMKDLSEALGQDLYAVKFAWGATSLEQQTPPLEDWSEKTVGGLLDIWKGQINDANSFMDNLGKKMRIRGIFWTQGESDASWSNLYYQNLINFFADVRAFCIAINTANGTTGKSLTNIITTLNPLQYGGSPQIDEIIQAQIDYVSNYGGVLINTATYPLKIDQAHFTADGIVTMGQDAAAAVELVF